MADFLIQKFQTTEVQNQMYLRGRRGFDKMKSKFSKNSLTMISTNQLISITDISGIEHGHFMKIKINESFICLRV